MKYNYLLVFLLVVFINPFVRSQNELISEGFCLDRNQVQFTIPEGYTFEDNSSEELRCIQNYAYRPMKLYYKITSKDDNVVAFIDIAPIYSRDSIFVYHELGPDQKRIKIDDIYINSIIEDLRSNTNIKYESLQDAPVTYKPTKYAKKAFNADRVISYSLDVDKENPLDGKYNHCEAMTIQKDTRGYITLFIFYNDQASKKLDKYLKSLEKMFWYRDPKDYIDFKFEEKVSTGDLLDEIRSYDQQM